jgi:hypothetical protein
MLTPAGRFTATEPPETRAIALSTYLGSVIVPTTAADCAICDRTPPRHRLRDQSMFNLLRCSLSTEGFNAIDAKTVICAELKI